MDSTTTSSGERDTLAEQVEDHLDATSAGDQAIEPFLACIVRLGQSDAEEVFRKATK